MQGKAKVFEEVIAAQKGRLILWLPVMLGVGSALYFTLKAEPPWVLAAGAVAAALLAAALLWPARQGAPPVRAGWIALTVLLWAAGGFAAAQWRTHAVAAPMLEREIRFAVVEGTVAEVEKLEEGKGQRVILRNLVIEDMAPERTPQRIRLKIRDEDTVRAGTRVKVLASLSPPSPPVIPGAFDFQRYAYFRQIGAFGFTYRPLETVAPAAGNSIARRIEQTREDIVARLSARMEPRESAIAAALMIGERAAVSEADWDAMRVSGLAHMLSISGMHVGLVAAVVFFAARLGMAAVPPLALRYPIKKIAALLALLAAAFYTGLAVPSVPSYRALLMTGLVLFAVMIDRKPFSMRTIAIAAMIVILAAPESVWSASFQMSFAATAALIFFFEETTPLWARWRRSAGPFRRGALYVAGVCGTTVVAGLATAPFAIFHFQQFAVYSVLANLLAVPVLSFVVMPAIIMSFILMPLGTERPAVYVMDWGIKVINAISHQVAALPHAQLIVPAWPLAALLFFSGGMIVLFLWGGRSRWVLAGAALVAVVCVAGFCKRPDALVSGDGGLMAVRLSDGRLSLSSARKDKFTAGIWLRYYGQAEDAGVYWPREGAGEGGVTCDPAGCRARTGDRKIAFSFDAAGQMEDCAWADIVIAQDPVREACAAPVVIDRFDMWRGGAHALWPDGTVQSVEADRGARPWTVTSAR